MVNKMTLEQFKIKLEKIIFLRDIGLLNQEDLEKFKKELLEDINK